MKSHVRSPMKGDIHEDRSRASRRIRLGLAALALFAILPAGCSRDQGVATPDGETGASKRAVATASGGAEATFPQAPVIFISVDTLRSDRLPAYGYSGVETPAFDAFRRDSILYERAYSHYPLTLPSHASLFTGLLPGEHGVRDNIGYTLDTEKFPYLPSLLQERGYATGAAVSTVVLEKPTGLDAGFSFYDDEIDLSKGGFGLSSAQRPGDETRAAAISWLREQAGAVDSAPPFLFFHIYEPHSPYNPPEPFASRYEDRYDGDIAFADAVLGRFLDDLRELGLYEESIIFLFSDHGEGLSDHGEAEHGVLVYREAIQVPLMLKLPSNRFAGASTRVSAQLIDLAPTTLSLLGLPVPEAMGGTSLLSLLDEGATERPIYSETFYPRLHLGWNELISLIEDEHHLIQGPDPELFNMSSDPGETQNVLLDQRRRYARMKGALEPFQRALEKPSAISEEAASKLAALGYLSTSSNADEGPLPDPKSRIHTLDLLQESHVALATGRHAEAVESVRKLLRDSPEMPTAWVNLGLGLMHLDQLEEAVEAYKEAIKLGGPQPRLVVRLATLFEALGQPDEAVKMLRATIEYGVDHPSVTRQLGLSLIALGHPGEAIQVLRPMTREGKAPELNAYGVALYATGRLDEAQVTFERVLQENPDNAKALESLGGVMLARRRAEEAKGLLERAVEIDPSLPIAWNSLGVARQWTGDTPGALAAWQRATELAPRDLDVLFNLGRTAAQSGQRQLAIEILRKFVAKAPASRASEVAQARQALAQLERG